MGRRLLKTVLLALIVLAGIAVIMERSGNLQVQASSPVQEKTAPEFTLKNLRNESVTLRSVIRGHKVTLLNFWATWCPPCRREIPELNRLYKEYASKSVEIVGVSSEENSEALKQFVNENNMRFPVLLDTDGKISQLYQIYYIPMTFVIDSSGKIRQVIQGGTTYETLKKAVDNLIRGE